MRRFVRSWAGMCLGALAWPAIAAQGGPAPTADRAAPYTHRVVEGLTLSLGVSIDDPNRIILWKDDKPYILERSKDTDHWAGDPKYWSEGEFVENKFPSEYLPGTPGVNVRCSKHVRIIYGNNPKMTEEYVEGNLRMFEECLKLYYLKIGFPVPFESRDPAKRDGKKHKVDVLVGASNLPSVKGKEMFTGGGAFGGFDGDRGFGFLYVGPDYMRHTPPSGATPHELAHSCQNMGNTHSKGSGFWWEADANWMMLQFINNYPTIETINGNASFYMGHGRHYYDCWQIFEHLKDEPQFGYAFVTRLWAEGPDQEYIWSKAQTFASQMTPPQSMSDEWGKTARANVAWDYKRHDTFIKEDKGGGRTALEPVPLKPGWYRIPWAMAPQQFGYNICPLKPTARTVTVDFQGLADPERGSDWRASLVAVTRDGRSRYSTLWDAGRNSLTLNADDRDLYLVVCATPKKVMEITADMDYRSAEKAMFPYQVKLEGAVPIEPPVGAGDFAANKEPAPHGKPHPNGGGFVADSAHVDASAYVGPGARVLGIAKVLGAARIEGRAVIRDRAVVKDHAIVSGEAYVKDAAQVSEYARLADHAYLREDASVSGHARMIEFAGAGGRVKISGNAVLKGRAFAWGGNVAGDAILAGDYANAMSVSKNVWFLWFINTQQKADQAADLHGLYAQYTFDHPHPYLAWDTNGDEDGLLVGAPQIRSDESIGRWEPVADRAGPLTSLDLHIGKENCGALVRGYLHPPKTGRYTFWVASDNESEFWLSPNASPAAKKRMAGVTGAWTGPGEFDHFPSQKSVPVQLEAGRVYYFEALLKQGDGADLLQVAWDGPGRKREIIRGEFLSEAPRGPVGQASSQIWFDMPGVTVKDLTRSPKFKPEARRHIADHYLELDGKQQYVELRRDIAYQPDLTCSMWVKRQPGTANQTLFEFSSADGRDLILLQLAGAEGRPTLTVRHGGKQSVVAAKIGIAPGHWEQVGAGLGADGASILVAGRIAAEDPSVAVEPWDLRIDQGFLGRSTAGEFLNGGVRDVSFYSVAQNRRPSQAAAQH